jgi:hypothetical protein
VKKFSENGHSIKQLKFLPSCLPFLKKCSRIFRPNDVEAGDLFENSRSALERCGINWFWVSVKKKKKKEKSRTGTLQVQCTDSVLPLVNVRQ